jgi:hypothetical protein
VKRATATKVRESRAIGPLRREDGPRSEGYRTWLSALLSQKQHQAAFRRAITKDRHPHFMMATKHAAAYAIGLPVQPMVDLTPREPVSLTAGQLLDALPRLVQVLPGAARVLQAIEVTGGVVD